MDELVTDVEWIFCGHAFHSACLDLGKEKGPEPDAVISDQLRKKCAMCRKTISELMAEEKKLLEQRITQPVQTNKRKKPETESVDTRVAMHIARLMREFGSLRRTLRNHSNMIELD